MKTITEEFLEGLQEYAKQHQIPLIPFEKKQRKEEIVAGYFRDFAGREGIVFIGKAQEKTRTFRLPETGQAPPRCPDPSALSETANLIRKLDSNSTSLGISSLKERMQRLQETMDVLIGSIDEFREDLVHTLRNLPDRLPPPVHIHSLPLDPTAPDFGERVNAIPREVTVRLRHEAGRGGGGESVAAATALPLVDLQLGQFLLLPVAQLGRPLHSDWVSSRVVLVGFGFGSS
jgi:hypothetical protein